MVERRLQEPRAALRLLAEADAETADEAVHRALAHMHLPSDIVRLARVVSTVQMAVNQLDLRLDEAAALQADAPAVFRRERAAPRVEVALDVVAEIVVDGVLVCEPADLRNEIDVLAALARPRAVDAEVAFLVFAAAARIGGASLHVASGNADAPVVSDLLVVADLDRRVVHLEVRLVLVARRLAAVDTRPNAFVFRRKPEVAHALHKVVRLGTPRHR